MFLVGWGTDFGFFDTSLHAFGFAIVSILLRLDEFHDCEFLPWKIGRSKAREALHGTQVLWACETVYCARRRRLERSEMRSRCGEWLL